MSRPARARRGVAPVRVAACLTVGAIMADTTGSTLALPLLARDPIAVHLAVTDLSWLATLNLVVPAALLATAGRAADLLGRRLVLAFGLASMIAGAVLVLLAPSWPALVAGRVLSGLGGATMFPGALSLLLDAVGQVRRRSAMVTWGTASGVGGVLLNMGAGWLLDLGWRALFVPSAVAAAVALLLVPALPKMTARTRKPDVPGMLLLVGGLGLAMYAITSGSQWGWTSPVLLATVAASATCVLLVVRRSRQHPGAVLEADLWRRPGLRFGAAVAAVTTAITYSAMLVLPLQLQSLGVGRGDVGWWLAPMAAVGIVVAPVAGAISRRSMMLGIYCGSLVMVAGAAALIVTADRPPGWWLIVGTLAVGTGSTLVFTGASIVGNSATAPEQYGAAVGAISTARVLGGALGMAAAAAVLANPLPQALSESPTLPGYSTTLQGGLALSAVIATATLIRWTRTARPAEAEDDWAGDAVVWEADEADWARGLRSRETVPGWGSRDLGWGQGDPGWDEPGWNGSDWDEPGWREQGSGDSGSRAGGAGVRVPRQVAPLLSAPTPYDAGPVDLQETLRELQAARQQIAVLRGYLAEAEADWAQIATDIEQQRADHDRATNRNTGHHNPGHHNPGHGADSHGAGHHGPEADRGDRGAHPYGRPAWPVGPHR
ncbi:MFS transporter [Nonomuraea sp. NPDC050328]|uniref:MFS transporter n=1 Tax=Nonomuraea sp. NPDC050328 TaxID=3364361 RepID=UPI00378BDC8B